jgi:uncharacterized membrane protein
MTKFSNTLYDIALISIVFVLIDGVFLYANSEMFIKQVISVQRTALQIKPVGAIACYVFLIFGLYYFIIRERRSIWDAFLFGVVIYAVYELTTYALLKNWRIQTVIQDTLWGGVLFATTTWIVYNIR